MNNLRTFVSRRVHTGAWALLVILIVLILQNTLSDSIAIHELTPVVIDGIVADEVQYTVWQIIKLLVFIPALVFWILDRRKELRTAILLSNALLTFELISSVVLLVLSLAETQSRQDFALIRDTLIVMGINVLSFSLWYWWIDVPTMRDERAGGDERWDFLFPQRSNPLPGFADWHPWYLDYLFLAIITTTTFGPAETAPLSGRAKFLMGLQVVLAFTILTVLAGRALSLVGN